MGKDFPYYCLWRLLAPDALATFDAFESFPEEQRRRYFIRRTKEEMVRTDGRPLYPQRRCDTLSYALSAAEQALYDATTRYIAETHNKARKLNRAAARLAMSVFQRRLASSTCALMRSFERRIVRLDEAVELARAGRVDELERRQTRIADTPDFFESRTADEDAGDDGEPERHEAFEEAALGGLVTTVLSELREERAEVEVLLSQARRLAEAGNDSKFEKLRALMADPAHAREKLIVFTEHRDTAEFLVHRLEGLGFTGQVALIHGGLDYRDREAQVELFRRPADMGGAGILVATDAAGEGINLQFCWLMVNYDVPWNPARLEQRMGRIHRYGQTRDPVVIVNLIAGETREGRVIGVLLEKLEAIRTQLRSDKVFDVVGRLFENVPLKGYLEMATTESGARGIPPGGVPLARQARRLTESAQAWLREDLLSGMTRECRSSIRQGLPERLHWAGRGYDHKIAELMAKRRRLSGDASQGDVRARTELAIVKKEQSRLVAEKKRGLTSLEAEASRIEPGEITMIAHALVVPTDDPEERQRHDARVEAVAMERARAHEEAAGAVVHDVSRPELARREGLGDWPGFDLRSQRPAGPQGPEEERAIEVKGRAASGAIEVSENEWAAACNLRDRYWLYVVFDCATPRPRLVRVRDPFGRLLARAKGSVVIAESEILSASMGGAETPRGGVSLL